MAIFMLLVVFMMGTAVGSFVGVLIYRTLNTKKGSAFEGRSSCDKCDHQLAWYENIPLVSFVLLGGKCRKCKYQIPWTYPLVELVTGVLFVWWATLGLAFFKLTQAPLLYIQPIFWLIVGVMLIVIFFADVSYGIIPDFATYTIGVSTLAYRLFLVYTGAMRFEDLVAAVVTGTTAAGVFGAIYLTTNGKGMGFGDVKLAPVMGLLLGYPKGLVGFFLSFVIGGVVAMGLLITRRKKRKQTLPFGPFLVMGLVIALLWGDGMWGWYMGLMR